MTETGKSFSSASLYPVMLVAGMALIFPGPAMDVLIHKFEISKSVAGRIPLLFFLGQFAGLFFLSTAAQILGVKKLFTLGLALLAAALCAIALAPGFYLLPPLFFIAGFADAALWSFPGVITTASSAGNVNRAMNYLYAFFSIGVTVEPVFAAQLLRQGLSHGAVLFFIAGLAVLVCGWVLSRPLPEFKDIEQLSFSGFAALIRSRGRLFILLALGMFCYIASEQGLSVWIPAFMTSRSPANLELAALTLSGIWFFLAAGRFFFGWVSKWVDRTVLLFALTLASLIISVAAALAPRPAATMALYLGYGLAMSGIFPLLLAFCQGFEQRHLPMAFGLILAGGYLGGAVGSFPVGFLSDHFSFPLAMLFPASLNLILLAIIPLLAKASRQDKPKGP